MTPESSWRTCVVELDSPEDEARVWSKSSSLADSWPFPTAGRYSDHSPRTMNTGAKDGPEATGRYTVRLFEGSVNYVYVCGGKKGAFRNKDLYRGPPPFYNYTADPPTGAGAGFTIRCGVDGLTMGAGILLMYGGLVGLTLLGVLVARAAGKWPDSVSRPPELVVINTFRPCVITGGALLASTTLLMLPAWITMNNPMGFMAIFIVVALIVLLAFGRLVGHATIRVDGEDKQVTTTKRLYICLPRTRVTPFADVQRFDMVTSRGRRGAVLFTMAMFCTDGTTVELEGGASNVAVSAGSWSTSTRTAGGMRGRAASIWRPAICPASGWAHSRAWRVRGSAPGSLGG